jgi:hypothetical protein
VRPFSSVTTVAFLVFIFFLPETNAAAGLVGPRAAHLGLRAVDAQFDAFGRRVRKDVARVRRCGSGRPGTTAE